MVNNFFKFIFIILILFFSFSCSSKKNKYPDELNNKINFYLEQYKKFPDDVIFLIQIAELLFENNYLNDSLNFLEKAEKKIEKNNKIDLEKILKLKIKILEKQNKLSDAIYNCKNLLNVNNNIENYILLSDLYFQNKDYLKAINILEELIAKEPNNIIILTKLGINFIKLNQFEEAEKYLLKVIELDFSNIKAHYYLSILYNKIGENDKFISELDKVILYGKNSNEPEVSFAFGIKAELFEKENNFDSAEVYFKNAIAINNKNWEIYFKYALLLFKKEKFVEAIEELKTAFSLNKNNYLIPLLIGDIYKEKLKLEKFAIKYYFAAYELNNNSIEILDKIGNYYFNEREYNQAIYYFEKIVDFNQKNFYTLDAYLKIVYMLVNYDNYNIALQRINQALNLFPNAYELYFQKAIIYEKQKNYDAAIQNYLEAIKYNEDFDSPYIFAAKLLYETNRKEEALNILEKCLQKIKDENLKINVELFIKRIENKENDGEQ
ncbi:MAG TPA: tetratricopeptide repeat protein [bacterium]|nr:tetratricopeptide repeat protein [bacterium]